MKTKNFDAWVQANPGTFALAALAFCAALLVSLTWAKNTIDEHELDMQKTFWISTHTIESDQMARSSLALLAATPHFSSGGCSAEGTGYVTRVSKTVNGLARLKYHRAKGVAPQDYECPSGLEFIDDIHQVSRSDRYERKTRGIEAAKAAAMARLKE
ncbi:MAG: hypothetical protein RLZZ324_1103 [Candidatus Parcubacteria bacterium]